MLIGVVFAYAVVASVATPCIDPTWSDNEIVVKKNITFGAVIDVPTGQNMTLRLDAYFPPKSDNRPLRPGAVIVHGGAFMAGDSGSESEIAYRLASRGFVAVSINYRLDGGLVGLGNNLAALAATEDARAAVRFVRKMAKDWRVDENRILIYGSSAGAITSLYLGYVKTAQYEGNSGNPGYNSSVAMAVSVSGELKAEAFCKTIHPKPENCAVEPEDPKYDYTNDLDGSTFQPPLLMVHGTEDTVVPYANGKAVYDRAQAVGITSKLITIPNGSHVPNYSNYFPDFMTFIVDTLKLGEAECPQPSLLVVYY
eukprot:TRINITY_DN76580_c0_g1_i1.p1 TRINITY_DN76580_c0_g1~~TRINITY_DN76580_c0_g1_i1.p1  ORF type:complete len:311 (+),score=51.98 TRINITY_DN76580_c0_g1_i1:169-1101(+)